MEHSIENKPENQESYAESEEENKTEITKSSVAKKEQNLFNFGFHFSDKAKVEPTGLPSELLVKHPLQSRWVLWYLKADRNKNWEDCLKQVASFDTIEDFWANWLRYSFSQNDSLYNFILTASGLTWGNDYYLFKEGIKPMWEDENNIYGGRWLVVVDKSRRLDLLDQYWLELILAMIGEQFEEHGENICGAVANVRQKGDKVSLWTRHALKVDVNTRIGQILKAKLQIPDYEAIRYEAHSDLSHKTGSTAKSKIVLPSKETKDYKN